MAAEASVAARSWAGAVRDYEAALKDARLAKRQLTEDNAAAVAKVIATFAELTVGGLGAPDAPVRAVLRECLPAADRGETANPAHAVVHRAREQIRAALGVEPVTRAADPAPPGDADDAPSLPASLPEPAVIEPDEPVGEVPALVLEGNEDPRQERGPRNASEREVYEAAVAAGHNERMAQWSVEVHRDGQEQDREVEAQWAAATGDERRSYVNAYRHLPAAKRALAADRVRNGYGRLTGAPRLGMGAEFRKLHPSVFGGGR